MWIFNISAWGPSEMWQNWLWCESYGQKRNKHILLLLQEYISFLYSFHDFFYIIRSFRYEHRGMSNEHQAIKKWPIGPDNKSIRLQRVYIAFSFHSVYKISELWLEKLWLLHHNNACAKCTLAIKQF